MNRKIRVAMVLFSVLAISFSLEAGRLKAFYLGKELVAGSREDLAIIFKRAQELGFDSVLAGYDFQEDVERALLQKPIMTDPGMKFVMDLAHAHQMKAYLWFERGLMAYVGRTRTLPYQLGEKPFAEKCWVKSKSGHAWHTAVDFQGVQWYTFWVHPGSEEAKFLRWVWREITRRYLPCPAFAGVNIDRIKIPEDHQPLGRNRVSDTKNAVTTCAEALINGLRVHLGPERAITAAVLPLDRRQDSVQYWEAWSLDYYLPMLYYPKTGHFRGHLSETLKLVKGREARIVPCLDYPSLVRAGTLHAQLAEIKKRNLGGVAFFDLDRVLLKRMPGPAQAHALKEF